MNQQIRTVKPVKMFVYLPVYLEAKKPGRPPTDGFEPEYIRTVIKELQFSRIEVGDSFIIEKRDRISDLIKIGGELKVEQVKRSLMDGSCIVVLEKMTFTNKEEMSEFLKNKRSSI